MLSRGSRVHFAACNYTYNNRDRFVGGAHEVTVIDPLVPPILYRERPGHVHLMLDLFRNSWVRELATDQIQIPYIKLALDDD